jgi:hypothetical protein
MSEKVDLSTYEGGMQVLAEKLKFPPNYDGSEMTIEQKKAMITTFVNFIVMS